MKLKVNSQFFCVFCLQIILALLTFQTACLTGRMVRFALGQKLEMILKVTQLKESADRMLLLVKAENLTGMMQRKTDFCTIICIIRFKKKQHVHTFYCTDAFYTQPASTWVVNAYPRICEGFYVSQPVSLRGSKIPIPWLELDTMGSTATHQTHGQIRDS